MNTHKTCLTTKITFILIFVQMGMGETNPSKMEGNFLLTKANNDYKIVLSLK